MASIHCFIQSKIQRKVDYKKKIVYRKLPKRDKGLFGRNLFRSFFCRNKYLGILREEHSKSLDNLIQWITNIDKLSLQTIVIQFASVVKSTKRNL